MAQFIAEQKRWVNVSEVIAHFDGAHKSTVYRLLRDLEDSPHLCHLQRDLRKGLVFIDPAEYRLSLRLSRYDATMLMLAARLLARHADKPSPAAVRGLRALGVALAKMEPNTSDYVIHLADAMEQRVMSDRAQDEQRMLNKLIDAWAERRSVNLYTRAEPNHPRPFDPYAIEPSGIGFLTYVIGFDHSKGGLRTFSLERLAFVSETSKRFELPSDFDINDLLAPAWGVNYGDGKARVRVRLQFVGENAVRRMQESQFHPSQVNALQADGSLIVSFEIGDTLEMRPFVLGWGAQVRVLEPPELRDFVRDELRRAAEGYADL